MQLDYIRFTQKHNLLRSLTRSLRLNFENQLAKNVKTNPKYFWDYVNSKIKAKTGIATLMSSNGEKSSSISESRNEAKHTYKADWYGLNHFIVMNSSDGCFYSDDIETA